MCLLHFYLVLDCTSKYHVFQTQSGFIDRDVTLEYSIRTTSDASLTKILCLSGDETDEACSNYLGQIEVTKQAANLEVVSIQESQESQDEYRNKGAQIVLERNSQTNEYTVYRYWVANEEDDGVLQVAKLFSSNVYAQISSLHVVSDEYALAVVSSDA